MGREYIGNPLLEFFYGYAPRTRETPQRMGIGSGVIVSEDGYIITNNHVIDKSDKITVTLDNKTEYEAKVIGTDPSTDIALLKVEANGLPYLEYANSDDVELGEWVLAVGNPYNLTSTVTAGIISAKARELGINRSQMSLESFLQTDAAVNPGNSGGALVNAKGELIGINTAIESPTGSYSGYSFAVPSNIARKVVGDLKEFGTVQRAMMGISMWRDELTPAVAKELGTDEVSGIYVYDVIPNGAAAKAGIKKGDIIIAINDVPVKTASALQEQVNRYRPGDKIKVTIHRGKDTKTLSVTLKNNQGNTEITKTKGIESLGAAFKELKDNTKRELNISSGVQVVGIKAGKFQRAGIRDGFIILNINGVNVKSVDTIESIFNDIMKGNSRDKVMFITGIYPNGKTGYYAVDLSE